MRPTSRVPGVYNTPSRGFTPLEHLAVIAIIGVLSTKTAGEVVETPQNPPGA